MPGRAARRPTATLLVAGLALGLAACSSSDPSVATGEDALRAAARTLDGSWTLEGDVEVAVDRAEVLGALARDPGLLGDVLGERDAAGDAVRDGLADLARDRLRATRADDGSLRLAVARDGATWLDLRSDDGGSLVQVAADLDVAGGLVGALDADVLAGGRSALALAGGAAADAVVPLLDALLDGRLLEVAGLPDGAAARLLPTGDGVLVPGEPRVEDGLTVVDLALRPRALPAPPPLVGLPAVDQRPDLVEHAGRLLLDADGALVGARVDLAALAVGLGVEPDDQRTGRLLSLAAELPRTGAWLALDLTPTGPATTLGEPAARADLAAVTEVVGLVAPGLLGGDPTADLRAAMPDADALGDVLADLLGVGRDDGSGGAGGVLLAGGLLDLPVGACFDDALLFGGDGGPVPCGEVHDDQLVAELELPDGPHDLDATQRVAEQACAAPVAAFLGGDPDGTRYLVGALVPTAAEWDAGLRTAQCYVFTLTPTAGSAEDALS